MSELPCLLQCLTFELIWSARFMSLNPFSHTGQISLFSLCIFNMVSLVFCITDENNLLPFIEFQQRINFEGSSYLLVSTERTGESNLENIWKMWICDVVQDSLVVQAYVCQSYYNI